MKARMTRWANPILIVAPTATVAVAATYLLSPSNIDPAHKFSWGENIGWMNWLDADGGADGVFVGADFLSGYIWMENAGWLNVGNGNGPYGNTGGADFGVNILANEDLEGFAWGENIGWVNVGWAADTANANRARFDFTAGRFRGHAWGENVGWLNLDDPTHYVGIACPVAAPPVLAQWDSNAGAGTTLVDLKMNRYLGLRAPGSSGRSQAIRVEFTLLPPPFDIWEGEQLWVQEPVNICEVGGSDAVGPPCPSGTTATFPRAYLGCSPVYRDWTTVPGGTVYVTHPAIVPKKTILPAAEAQYEIRVIDVACNTAQAASFSAPVQLLQTKYGDMAGPFDPSGNYYTAPEGANVGIGTDVTSVLGKFSNRTGAPVKPRSDLEPCRLDARINIADVTEALNGFRNLAYRFAPGAGNCLSLDPCGYAAAE